MQFHSSTDNFAFNPLVSPFIPNLPSVPSLMQQSMDVGNEYEKARSDDNPSPAISANHLYSKQPLVSTVSQIKNKSKTGGSRRNKQTTPDQNLDLQYTKTELNAAQATIVVLEDTIRDLKFRNTILEDRIKQLEGKMQNDITNKYFPNTNTEDQRNHHHCHQIHHQCCVQPLPRCVCKLPQCGQGRPDCQESLKSLQKDVAAIKLTLNNLDINRSNKQGHSCSIPDNSEPVVHASPEISDNISNLNESFVSADDDEVIDEALLNDLN